MWASTGSTIEGASPDVSPGASRDSDAADALRALDSSPDAPRLLVFTAAGRTCACELTAIREIIPCRRATRLPGAPPFVTGLINLRGSIVTVLDLGARLGGTPVDPERGSIILAESGPKVVGLAVDELRDVQRVVREAIEPAEAETGPDGLVAGVLHIGAEVAVLLDVGRIITLALV